MSIARRSILKLAGVALLALKGGWLPKARPPLPGGDPTTPAPKFSVCDSTGRIQWPARRPSKVHVFFTREQELRFDFKIEAPR